MRKAARDSFDLPTVAANQPRELKPLTSEVAKNLSIKEDRPAAPSFDRTVQTALRRTGNQLESENVPLQRSVAERRRELLHPPPAPVPNRREVPESREEEAERQQNLNLDTKEEEDEGSRERAANARKLITFPSELNGRRPILIELPWELVDRTRELNDKPREVDDLSPDHDDNSSKLNHRSRDLRQNTS